MPKKLTFASWKSDFWQAGRVVFQKVSFAEKADLRKLEVGLLASRTRRIPEGQLCRKS
ncbi:MAG: hypothetical protein KDI55_20975 [Anaerolineae bacterium]|nr:hypothetical protein [Anaerolineae bacterium]